MSNLEHRRESPRRRAVGGMHPGFRVVLQAFGAGMILALVLAGIAIKQSLEDVTSWVFGVIGMLLFWRSLCNAEHLTTRKDLP